MGWSRIAVLVCMYATSAAQGLLDYNNRGTSEHPFYVCQCGELASACYLPIIFIHSFELTIATYLILSLGVLGLNTGSV